MRSLSFLLLGLLLAGCQPTAAGLVPVAGGPTRTPVVHVSDLPAAAPAVVGQPVALRIPSLGLQIAVDPVALDADGAMQVPAWEHAGWYALGPRPGEVGQAVIAGHLTTRLGTAGPFWRLEDLQPGQYVIVTDDQQQEISFRVLANDVFEADSVPLAEVFGYLPTSRLNLITCTGEWDWPANGFSQRRVVFAERES